MDLNAIKDLLLAPKQRYYDEPQDSGRQAEMSAGAKYGKMGEWSKADAAKHMAWQGELARRIGSPGPLATLGANVLGVGKEVVIDGLGSAANYAIGSGEDPRDTWKNSLMDAWNNYVGASNQYSPEQAVEAAGKSTNSIWEALSKGLPYSQQQ